MTILSISESVKFWRGHSDIFACNQFNGIYGLQMPTDQQIKRWSATTVHCFSTLKTGMVFYSEHAPKTL